jgi:hypothetical protein
MLSIIDMSTSAPQPSQPNPDEQMIRDFIAGEGESVSPETAARYQIVVDALFEFLETVDVTDRMGPQIARYLESERERLGPGAFMPTLGLAGFLRVLPEFLTDPWLPPIGASRRTHRAIIDRLLTYLRRRQLIDRSAAMRDDFSRARRAIGTARARDYWRQLDSPEERIRVTVELNSRILDPLLADVEIGSRRSLADAIENQLEHRYYFPPTFRQA